LLCPSPTAAAIARGRPALHLELAFWPIGADWATPCTGSCAVASRSALRRCDPEHAPPRTAPRPPPRRCERQLHRSLPDRACKLRTNDFSVPAIVASPIVVERSADRDATAHDRRCRASPSADPSRTPMSRLQPPSTAKPMAAAVGDGQSKASFLAGKSAPRSGPCKRSPRGATSPVVEAAKRATPNMRRTARLRIPARPGVVTESRRRCARRQLAPCSAPSAKSEGRPPPAARPPASCTLTAQVSLVYTIG